MVWRQRVSIMCKLPWMSPPTSNHIIHHELDPMTAELVIRTVVYICVLIPIKNSPPPGSRYPFSTYPPSCFQVPSIIPMLIKLCQAILGRSFEYGAQRFVITVFTYLNTSLTSIVLWCVCISTFSSYLIDNEWWNVITRLEIYWVPLDSM